MKIDHNIFDDDSFHPEKGEAKDKLNFFWENCLPEEEDDVAASIREKTLRKIQEGTGLQVLPSKRKKANRLYMAVASIAATIAVLLSIPYVLRMNSHQEDIKQVVAILDMSPLEETDDVVLVMSDQEKLQLASMQK